MTKADLIAKMSQDAGITAAAATTALNTFMESVANALKKKKKKKTDPIPKFSLIGFGTFYVTERKKRKGRNPRTGEVIDIKKGTVIKFRPGKKLKDAV
jgi:DNA-binding protein HU-beta